MVMAGFMASMEKSKILLSKVSFLPAMIPAMISGYPFSIHDR